MSASIALNHTDRKRLAEDIKGHLYKEAIRFMLGKKQQGTSNYEIYAGLIELGVDNEQANYLVSKLGDYATEMKEQAIKTIKYSIILIVIGSIGFCIGLTIDRYISLTGTFMLLGVVQIIIYLVRKKQYEKVLAIIQQENALRNKQQ
jgi:hypothetical protein